MNYACNTKLRSSRQMFSVVLGYKGPVRGYQAKDPMDSPRKLCLQQLRSPMEWRVEEFILSSSPIVALLCKGSNSPPRRAPP